MFQCNRAHQLSDFSTNGGRIHLVLGHRHARCSDPISGWLCWTDAQIFKSFDPLRRLSKCSCSDQLGLRARICSAGEELVLAGAGARLRAGARRMAVKLRLALPLPSLFSTLARSWSLPSLPSLFSACSSSFLIVVFIGDWIGLDLLSGTCRGGYSTGKSPPRLPLTWKHKLFCFCLCSFLILLFIGVCDKTNAITNCSVWLECRDVAK